MIITANMRQKMKYIKAKVHSCMPDSLLVNIMYLEPWIMQFFGEKQKHKTDATNSSGKRVR